MLSPAWESRDCLGWGQGKEEAGKHQGQVRQEEGRQKENVVSESPHFRDSDETFSSGLMLIPDGSGQVIPVHRMPGVQQVD